MRIYIGADHAGFDLKESLRPFLSGLGHEVVDQGASEKNSSDDYPDFVLPVARAVSADPDSRGIVIGSSGQGEAMAANRVPGVRAMVYYGDVAPVTESDKATPPQDIVRDSREDNDSNVLSLGASFVTPEEAQRVVQLWLESPFSGEERHQRRINKFDSGVEI